MRYFITERQLQILKEYFDPVYFFKQKLKKPSKSFKPEENIKYEPKYQKLVDIIFRYTTKEFKVKNLEGLRVLKVTPAGLGWDILIEPIFPDWFNWKSNDRVLSNLKELQKKMNETSVDTGLKASNNDMNFHFWLN